MPDYDVIILGGGPAGMSALLWCNSLNLQAVLLERAPEMGGQMLEMFHRIFDYPGINGLTGRELRDRFLSHLTELKLDWRAGCMIEKVELSKRQVLCGGAWLNARALIIATGASKRKLGVPGEDKFALKGVSFSATRDHSLYAGKKVCVIGGSDSAIENSLILSRVCPEVTLIHRSNQFRARAEWLNEARANPLIKFVTGAQVSSIEGSDRVERVLIEDLTTREKRAIETEGVFIKIGVGPNTELFRDQIEFDEDGYLKVDQCQRTSVKGIYAAGDVCRPICLSVATAVGHGAIAAKDIALRGEEIDRINRIFQD